MAVKLDPTLALVWQPVGILAKYHRLRRVIMYCSPLRSRHPR